MRLIALVMALFLVSSCSLPGGRDRGGDPGYEPVPDATLFARAADVDGVEKADLAYSSTVGNEGYGGEITVASDLSRAEVGKAIATVYAILRQGRPNALMGFRILQGNTIVTGDLPGVPIGDLPGLEEEFGPQPGDGTPPPR